MFEQYYDQSLKLQNWSEEELKKGNRLKAYRIYRAMEKLRSRKIGDIRMR